MNVMKTYEELKQHIQQVIEQEKQDLICLNNDLADHPERLFHYYRQKDIR